MDSDEEAGLRAFELRPLYADGGGPPDAPRWLERDGVRIEIISIEAEWREEERYGFRVRLGDGDSLLLYYVPELALWSGAVARDVMERPE